MPLPSSLAPSPRLRFGPWNTIQYVTNIERNRSIAAATRAASASEKAAAEAAAAADEATAWTIWAIATAAMAAATAEALMVARRAARECGAGGMMAGGSAATISTGHTRTNTTPHPKRKRGDGASDDRAHNGTFSYPGNWPNGANVAPVGYSPSPPRPLGGGTRSDPTKPAARLSGELRSRKSVF